MFLNNVTCMLVVLFFLCVRKHASKVPTNILTRNSLWGSKRNVWDEKYTCGLLSEISFLFVNLWQCGVFSGTKVSVILFTNGVYRKLFTMYSMTTICVYDFCETVLVKNTHTLPRYDLNFPFQNAVSLHWTFDGTSQTHLWALKRRKKTVEGAALKFSPGLTRPGPCEPVRILVF